MTILILLTAIIFAVGVFGGAEWISPLNLIYPSDAKSAPTFVSAVLKIRLLRMTAALVIGGSLALAGSVLQAALRNPLAEPFTLGVSGGAGLGAAIAIICGLRATNVYALQFSAFIGALAALLIVTAVGGGKFWRVGAVEPARVLLSGVMVSALAGSALMYLVQSAQQQDLARVVWWLLGDLQAATWNLLLPSAAVLVLAFAILRYHAADITALALGDAVAWNGGASPARLTTLILLIASLLTAATVALAGIIGFCGLIIPAVARRFFGCDYRRSLFPTTMLGAIFLMSADVAARIFFPAREMPIGVISALVGSPIFLYLLNRRSSR